ncbi:intercellular adhesion molecule 5-like [Gastrophryne carolinensis]
MEAEEPLKLVMCLKPFQSALGLAEENSSSNLDEYNLLAAFISFESLFRSLLNSGRFPFLWASSFFALRALIDLLNQGTVPIPVLHFEEKIIEGEETSIRCTLPYTETEEAELSIKMGNVSLPDCTQKKGIYPNITCNMEVTPEMHETEFTCEAQFKSYSKPAKMMILTEPEFTDCPEKVVWVEGQETSFHCKAKGYPAPMVTCGTNSTYKDGEKFTAAKNMSGIYICTAKNDDMVTKTVTVSVEYKPHILSIDIAPSLHGEGDKVTLTCQADGLPEPTYSWNVPSSNVTFSPNNQTVTVENLQKSQLGNYECIAHNQHGTATRENVLELVAKPKILEITAQPSTQVLEGDNVTLTCEASGFPPPVFGWETPNANVEYSQDRRTVTIWQVKKNNMGQYRCKAENAHGVDTQVLQLTLAGIFQAKG